MMNDINVMLEEQIRLLSEKMEGMDPGSEEYARAAKALSELFKARTEEDKIQTEDTRKGVDSRRDRKLRIAEIVIAALGGIVLPIAGLVLGLHFEESGSISSPITKDFMRKILKGR